MSEEKSAMWWQTPEILGRVVRFGCPVLEASVASREWLGEFGNLRRRRFQKVQRSLEQDLWVYRSALQSLQAALDAMQEFSEGNERYPFLGAIGDAYDELRDLEERAEAHVDGCTERLEAVAVVASPDGP